MTRAARGRRANKLKEAPGKDASNSISRTFGYDRKIVGYLSAAFLVLTILAVMVPLAPNLPSVGLDGSWDPR